MRWAVTTDTERGVSDNGVLVFVPIRLFCALYPTSAA